MFKYSLLLVIIFHKTWLLQFRNPFVEVLAAVLISGGSQWNTKFSGLIQSQPRWEHSGTPLSMGSSTLSVAPPKTQQLSLMSEQLSWFCPIGRDEFLPDYVWMCEHPHISPKGSFHTWAQPVRKDFGMTKNIILPHRIPFLLLPQMADCVESLAVNIPVSHSKRKTSHNKLYELWEINIMCIWRWNFSLSLKTLQKLCSYIIILLRTQNSYAAFCQVLTFP